jgi:cytochrome c peroxidase
MITLLALFIACNTSNPAPADDTPVVVEAAALMPFGVLPDNFYRDGVTPSPELVSLGKRLFNDPKLSSSGKISCNSCHDLAANGADKVAFSAGHEGHPVGRNSPTVFNAAGHVAQFWDGRAPDVEGQALGPILAAGEMAMPSESAVVDVLRADASYVADFAKAFPDQKDPVTFQNVGVAIGAFERGLVTPSRWDQFLNGDQAVLTNQEKRGFNTFVESGCASCHNGVLIGGGSYMKLGLVQPWPNQNDLGRFGVTGIEADKMVFKVPSLRNVTETAPYFHDGSAADLKTAIKLMGKHQLGKELTDEQTASIEVWLGSTSGKVK